MDADFGMIKTMVERSRAAAPPPPVRPSQVGLAGDAPMDIRFRVTIDGVDYDAPLEFDYSDLVPDEIKASVVLAGPDADPVRVTTAFMFIKLARDVPLEAGDYGAFHQTFAPMFSGDSSMILPLEDHDG